MRWRDQIVASHRGHVTNRPVEAASALFSGASGIAFGFTNFRKYWIRTLLYSA